MMRFTRAGGLAALALLLMTWPLHAVRAQVPTGAGINSASIIEFPTALDQPNDHALHASVEVVDVGEPDLRVENVRYGFQYGNLNILTDVHVLTEPKQEFDYGELRLKLRVLPLDEINTDIAVGLLGRGTDDRDGRARIDDRSASLFGIITSRLHLFQDVGPMMINLYLDNLHVSLGLKAGFYQFMQLVAEADYLHSLSEADKRSFVKAGIEIEGEQNFYFQLYYSDRNQHAVVQLGTSF